MSYSVIFKRGDGGVVKSLFRHWKLEVVCGPLVSQEGTFTKPHVVVSLCHQCNAMYAKYHQSADSFPSSLALWSLGVDSQVFASAQ